MDIQSLKTLLEIQALQSIGSNGQSNTNALTNNKSMFSDMIEEVLNGASTTGNTRLSTMGGTNYMTGLAGASSNFMNPLGGLNGASSNTTANNYFQSLLYSGSNSVYVPSSVGQYNQANFPASSTKLDSYVSPDVVGSTAYANALANANQYAAIIKKASATYNVPEKLIAAVMKQESNFKSNVVSRAGAQGLMQLMPSTAKYLGVTNSFDPEQNIMAGTKYLRQMLDKFGNDPTLALAAYNAGPSRVTKYGGIPPFKETQNYVKKVMNYYTV